MTAESRPSTIEKCIGDITECPICNEELQDNRCLPCLHMFCLKCLQSYRKGNKKGKPLPCPVCRREFSVPKSIADLPRNFFIDKLLDANNIRKHDKQDALPKICEICNEDNCKRRSTTAIVFEDTKVALATRFCCDCRQFMCISCERQHKKIKAISWHKIIDGTNVTDPQDPTPRPTYCIAHKKEAEVYCQECKMIICWQCKALSHSSHTSLDVSSATKELSAEFEEHIKQLSSRLLTTEDAILTLAQREKLYTDEINVELDKIGREHRKLCRKLTENRDKLKNALNTSTAVHLEAFKELRKKLETDAAELNRHKVYIEQMIHLGNVSDLCEYKNTTILKTASQAEEHTCRISVPPVTHLSDSDLQDLLTGKRTDIDHQYMDNADRSNDNYNKDILPKTKESKDRRSTFLMDNTDRSSDSRNQLHDETQPTGQLTGNFKGQVNHEEAKTGQGNLRTGDQELNILDIWSKRPPPTPLAKPASPSNSTTTRMLFDLKPSVKPCELKDETMKRSPPQVPLINPETSLTVTTNDNRSILEDETSDEDFSEYKDWSLIRTITPDDDKAICGVTAINSTLYVVSQDSNSVSVYSATLFAFLEKFTVHGLVNPNDIVSCKFNNCLYICDWGTARIFRVNVGEENEQINWGIDKDLGGISVTTEHTVLLAGHVSNRLKEYTPNGRLIRSIELRDDVKPWHAIKLDSSNTQYLICQGHDITSLHRVCLIDFDGNVKNAFGGDKGSDDEHLCGPYHLAVETSGCIYVTDCNNGRILLLSQNLKFVKEIIPSSSKVLRRARRACLDEDVGRLYVADNEKVGGEIKNGRILVFSNCHTLHLSNRRPTYMYLSARKGYYERKCNSCKF